MNMLWGVLMAIIGLSMLVCGTMKSDIVVYRLLVARSRILWGDAVHRFFQVSGLIVALLGILWASGVIWSNG
jgi:predicted DNA-binding transcriptional regulator